MAFVWDVLRRVCDGLDRPLILFVHDVEHTVCGSFERYEAFEEAFGSGRLHTPQVQLKRASTISSFMLPLVVIGGCSLGETGTHITSSSRCALAHLPECATAHGPHAPVHPTSACMHCQHGQGLDQTGCEL